MVTVMSHEPVSSRSDILTEIRVNLLEWKGTSGCRALPDLQEVLCSRGHPRPPAHHPEINPTEGLGSRPLCLHSEFWGDRDHRGARRRRRRDGLGFPRLSCGDHIDVDARGRVLLTDAQLGTLNQLVLDSSGCETPDVLQGFRKQGCCGASWERWRCDGGGHTEGNGVAFGKGAVCDARVNPAGEWTDASHSTAFDRLKCADCSGRRRSHGCTCSQNAPVLQKL
ncbi:uncharacterized protein LOC130557694 [Triplophysa rosa]|uniref:uncharacterized protein LOC130557694 n=1 Tax=Triplophysa rosa TaxID=992332 RepID=UPI002546160D|nr:uncharacterized protein LOC130557694 [Triplophysa rosa]